MKGFTTILVLTFFASSALCQDSPPAPSPLVPTPVLPLSPPPPAPLVPTPIVPVSQPPPPAPLAPPPASPPKAAPPTVAPPPPAGTPPTSGVTDADVLTFAYNLECLEGNFYSCAAFGTPLASDITGNGPAPSSCTKANLSSTVGTYAAELAREETAHVTFLYNALVAAGATPVCPFVNIDTAFEAAAEAAFNQSGTPLNPTFDPYANDVFFLHGSFIFEDTGASAYLGGVGLIQNATYRQAAAQIGNTESYHASEVRTLLFQILDTVPAYNATVSQITSAIVAIKNTLSGVPQLEYDLSNESGSSIANVDSNAFVPVATTTQVLQIVTLGAKAGNGGGFFPNNLVGAVKN